MANKVWGAEAKPSNKHTQSRQQHFKNALANKVVHYISKNIVTAKT